MFGHPHSYEQDLSPGLERTMKQGWDVGTVIGSTPFSQRGQGPKYDGFSQSTHASLNPIISMALSTYGRYM